MRFNGVRGTTKFFRQILVGWIGANLSEYLHLPLRYLDRVMITTMRSSMMETIPMTEAQFGLLTTAFLVVYGILSPSGGFLADRFNRSHVYVKQRLQVKAAPK